jgi:alcohol dehydrogenase (cytochrome c)
MPFRSGEFGNDTWKGDSWMRGGGSTWLTGTYDVDRDVLYWPIGNPGPDIDGSVRLGDNLFTCSVVALDPDTGQRKWHYQLTPGDTHDWDSTEDMVLVDRVFKGQQRKLLLHADRNGFFYVLDRTNGKFLSATAFVKQQVLVRCKWTPDIRRRIKCKPGGSIPVYPSLGGGTNFIAVV